MFMQISAHACAQFTTCSGDLYEIFHMHQNNVLLVCEETRCLKDIFACVFT